MAGQKDRAAADEAWSTLLAKYNEDRIEASTFLPGTPLPNFSAAALEEWLQKMSIWDTRANTRLETSCVLAGATLSALEQAGAQVKLQPGVVHVLSRLVALDTTFEVVSASWSAEMVKASITHAVPRDRPHSVYANRLLPEGNASIEEGDVVSTGAVTW